jgi:hypothetical protein
VVIAIPLLDKMQIARYGIQATSPCVCCQRTGHVTNATLPCCAFISWAWRCIVKDFPRNVISHISINCCVVGSDSFTIWSQRFTLHCFLQCTYLYRCGSNNWNSPIFSSVRRCKCSPHKSKTNCQTRVQAPFRPVLYAFVMYTSRCTTRCYTRSHVCQPLISSYFRSYKLRLAAVTIERCGRCGEEKHSYISLYGNVLDTQDL